MGDKLTQRVSTCVGCGAELVPDSAWQDRPDECDYQFCNVLWIGFHGGYGMFVDNLEVKLPTNSDERWIRKSDERDEFGMYCDYMLDDDGRLIDAPAWQPKYSEDRMLAGQPDYEAVICHDCAHELCRLVPWINNLLQPERSHSHRDDYHQAHPDHKGWDYEDRP